MAAATSPGFGALLRRYRNDAGLTQEELAESACLSRRGITALERGERLKPRGDTIRLLADALQLDGARRVAFEAAGRSRGEPAALTGEPPLIGRQRELQILGRHLGGEGSAVLLLSGEPGIGKTRLLHEASRQSAAEGWTVLKGGCQRQSAGDPYAPIVQALARHIGEQSPREVRSALRSSPWLVRLLPELLEIAQAPLPLGALPPHQERRLMFGAVVRYLATLGKSTGVLLVLDDLHWTGYDAIDLLSYLAQAAPGIPLRLFGAYRDTEVDPQHPLLPMVADLAREGLLTRLSPGPLTMSDANELLQCLVADPERLPPEARDRVLQRADGVPFFLVSYAHGLQEGAFDGAEQGELSWSMAESIRQRVRVLPEGTQQVLSTAAVAGRVVSPSLLAAALQHRHDELLPWLDTAERAGLLVADRERTYRFTHDVIREVVEGDLSASQRTLLHRHIADALERLTDSVRERRVAELAWHLVQGDEAGRALPYLLLSGDQAAGLLAHTEAERYYREAANIARTLGDRSREAQALERQGHCLRILTRYLEALQVLEQSALLYGAMGDPEKEAQVVAEIARVHASRGSPREALARIRAPLHVRPWSQLSPGLISLWATEARYIAHGERVEEALLVADHALAAARELGDEHLILNVLYVRSKLLHQARGAEEGLRSLEELIPLAEAIDDFDTLIAVLYLSAEIHRARGELEAAGQCTRRALARAEEVGDPQRIGIAAWHLYWLDEWNEAREHLERAVLLSRQLGEPPDASAVHIIYLGELRWAQGDWREARRLCEQGLTRCERSGDVSMAMHARMVLSELDMHEGHPDAAIARLEPHRTVFEETGKPGAFAHLAEAYVLADEPGKALEIVENEIASILHRRIQLGPGRVFTLRVKGVVLGHHGRWEDAKAAFEESLEIGAQRSYSWFLGRTRYDFGLMCIRMGEPEQGCARLREALSLFRKLGARAYAERSERALLQVLSAASRHQADG